MAKSSLDEKILLNGVDLTTVFRNASVPMNRGLRAHFADTRKALDRLERGRKAFDDALKDLEAQDKLGNCENTAADERLQSGGVAGILCVKKAQRHDELPDS